MYCRIKLDVKPCASILPENYIDFRQRFHAFLPKINAIFYGLCDVLYIK